MKIALVTDTHAGVRNDLECLQEHQNRFWANEFFPELKKRGINQIVHGGDFFDKRQYLTLKTMENTKNIFQKLLSDSGCHMTMILGNHDVLYRNTNIVNSPENLFGSDKNITIINEPTVVFDSMLLVPWINKENLEATLKIIKKSTVPYCLGHFEINGCEMHKGTVATEGLEVKTFKKFKKVFSGHFHTRSINGNIEYLGSPFEMTWNDYNDSRGWHIFDTETGDIEFIPYKESMFFKVEYDSKDNSRSWVPYKPEDLSGKFVKVIVTIKNSHYDFDMWLKRIQSYVPQELQVFDNNVSIEGIDFDVSDIGEGLSNLEIIESKIDMLSDSNYSAHEKNIIKTKMALLYNEVDA